MISMPLQFCMKVEINNEVYNVKSKLREIVSGDTYA